MNLARFVAVYVTALQHLILVGGLAAETASAGPDQAPGIQPDDAVVYLQQQIQTVRSQVELYKKEHNGRTPDLAAGWGQLVNTTNIMGQIGEGNDFPFGPYLVKPPANAFNKNASSVCLADRPDPRAGWAWSEQDKKFYAVVSDEAAAKLGLQQNEFVTNSAKAVRLAGAVRADMAVLRNAIELYQTEHQGLPPTIDRFADQLTGYTDVLGNVSPVKRGRYIYGPYIRKISVNKFTGERGVGPLNAPTAHKGWAYDEASGIIALVLVDPKQASTLSYSRGVASVLAIKPEAEADQD